MIDFSPHPRRPARPMKLEVDPAHAWMVGLVVQARPAVAARAGARGGLARGRRAASTPGPECAWAADASCTCPEFCERDHANE